MNPNEQFEKNEMLHSDPKLKSGRIWSELTGEKRYDAGRSGDVILSKGAALFRTSVSNWMLEHPRIVTVAAFALFAGTPIVLKVLDVISWSWWWTVTPLVISAIALVLITFAIAYIIYLGEQNHW